MLNFFGIQIRLKKINEKHFLEILKRKKNKLAVILEIIVKKKKLQFELKQ